MDANERVYVAAAINFFWGQGTATPESVNEEAAIVAYKALKEANVCSERLDFIPIPSYAPPTISYVIKQVVEIGKRIKTGDTSIYEACKAKVGVNYKTEINMKIQGF